MAARITTFLMFDGNAEEAVKFYISLFANSGIDKIDRFASGEPGAEGSVKRATFHLNGQSFFCIDSPAKHGFTFTPAISLFVDCESEAEIDRVFSALSAGGQVLMPLSAYPFAKKFGWTNDRYGVSWQLSWQSAQAA